MSTNGSPALESVAPRTSTSGRRTRRPHNLVAKLASRVIGGIILTVSHVRSGTCPIFTDSRPTRFRKTINLSQPSRLSRQVVSRLALLSAVTLLAGSAQAGAFRVQPYLQNPSQEAITVRWFSDTGDPGQLTLATPEGPQVLQSQPILAEALRYNPFKPEVGGPHPTLPWLHSIRVSKLKPGTKYRYQVKQGSAQFDGEFQTAPDPNQPIRFIVYSDPETEPESSTSPPVDWPVPPNSNRPAGITKYVTDQTTGYRHNCRMITERNPNFVLVTGDLVETGGEQRDWDEFWRHNAGEYGTVASRFPFFPAIGNHENFAGPGGGYSAEGANFATDKFLTYFEFPENGAANSQQKGRYYRIDYGPITLITLDSSDGLPNKTASDTNHLMEGSRAPDFNPASEQYRWLTEQLADAQQKSRFTFVQFHHTMYGSGPHSIPFGEPNFSGQSGIAMRVIQPLLFRYGVDAVFSGHDEMLERSQTKGTEVLPDGSTRPHEIHFYDVGIGGDGLRGPSVGYDNPHRKFLVHEQVPEVWEGRKLVSGGKHYGHLEVNVSLNAEGKWQAELTPVHVFPVMDEAGQVTGWERRTYDDIVRLVAIDPKPAAAMSVLDGPDRNGVLAACMVAGIAGLSWLLRDRKSSQRR